mgnify:CR=1 FL=1
MSGNNAASRIAAQEVIRLAKAHYHTVIRVIVGNESLLRGDVTRKQLYAYLDRVRAALDKVSLLNKEKSLPVTLSGGEQQRVGIARALVSKPPVLLADEPTGNLDTARSLEIMELLTRFNTEQGITIVMVTHDNELAQRATRTLLIADGEIIDETIAAGREQLSEPQAKAILSAYGLQVVETRIRWEPRVGRVSRRYDNLPVPALTDLLRSAESPTLQDAASRALRSYGDVTHPPRIGIMGYHARRSASGQLQRLTSSASAVIQNTPAPRMPHDQIDDGLRRGVLQFHEA